MPGSVPASTGRRHAADRVAGAQPAYARAAARPPARPQLLLHPAWTWSGEGVGLFNGDRLSQGEFHRRYETCAEDVKAELIGGIVYVASPTGDAHGRGTLELGTLLGLYQARTPGVAAGHDATTILADDSEPQPDLRLRLLPEVGGQSRVNRAGYLQGALELVIEVAHSSVAIDLHAKKEDYRRHGVREYLALCLRERRLVAFEFEAGRPRPRASDADGGSVS